MKLQLLLLVCFFALMSALAARRPSRLASSLSSSRDNYGLTARDDDFDICYPNGNYGWCWECDRDEPCADDGDCRDDDNDDSEYCVRGHCCEFERKRCRYDSDCDDDDD